MASLITACTLEQGWNKEYIELASEKHFTSNKRKIKQSATYQDQHKLALEDVDEILAFAQQVTP